MYEIKTTELTTADKEFHIVKDAIMERHRRFSSCIPDGSFLRRRDAPQRELVAAAYSQIILIHTATIAHAFDSGWYASGFTLVRPTLEALLKQVQLIAYEHDDDGWKRLIEKRLRVTDIRLNELTHIKESTIGLEWPDLRPLWSQISPWLNDFVHGGTGQVTSNPIDEESLPNYDCDWFCTAMFITTVSMASTSAWLLAHLGYEEPSNALLHDLAIEDWWTFETMRNGQPTRISR